VWGARYTLGVCYLSKNTVFNWSQKIKIKERRVKTGVENFVNREGLHTLLIYQTTLVRIHQINSEKYPFVFS
jgi:hypothetical protein